MDETIYLVADQTGIKRMTKNLPSLNRGEIPIKVNITVAKEAFRTPVIEKQIVIDDWREGIDIADVEFRKEIITPEEAETIRQGRLEKMQEILRQNGYTVAKLAEDEEESEAKC